MPRRRKNKQLRKTTRKVAGSVKGGSSIWTSPVQRGKGKRYQGKEVRKARKLGWFKD